MKQKASISTNNIGNTVLNVCDKVAWSFVSVISTIIMKMILRFKGISYGKSIRFYGLTKFKRSNNGIIKIGDNCIFRSTHTSNLIGINRPCIITALAQGSELIISDDCGFSGTVIGCFEKIVIGKNVMCGANTLITDSDWHPNDPRSRSPRPIIIGDNVWLGVNVTVLKGVNIGPNAIIGAGSVVTKDIPANITAAGNPCRAIK